MKRPLRRKSDEPLYVWCERIVDDLTQMEKEELLDAIMEISKQSYFQGSDTAFKSMQG